jgi:hypothetical protein
LRWACTCMRQTVAGRNARPSKAPSLSCLPAPRESCKLKPSWSRHLAKDAPNLHPRKLQWLPSWQTIPNIASPKFTSGPGCLFEEVVWYAQLFHSVVRGHAARDRQRRSCKLCSSHKAVFWSTWDGIWHEQARGHGVLGLSRRRLVIVCSDSGAGGGGLVRGSAGRSWAEQGVGRMERGKDRRYNKTTKQLTQGEQYVLSSSARWRWWRRTGITYHGRRRRAESVRV